MHNYEPFEMKTDDEKTAFIASRRFANLVATGPDGPAAAHIPMILSRTSNNRLVLDGHVAKSNAFALIAAEGGRGLAIFNGVDAYVTPSFYPSKQIHGKVVPTWNYIAVHAAGRLEIFGEGAHLRRHLESLTDTMEHGLPAPWTVDDAPDTFTERMVNAITGVRLHIDRIEGIRKLNQNMKQTDRDGALTGLTASDDPMARLVASEMAREADSLS